jgi:hypothetical protein
MTNPIAQIIYRSIRINLWIMELFVVIVETLLFTRQKKQWRQALITAIVLNASSVLVGLIMVLVINNNAASLMIRCATLSINNQCVIEQVDTADELLEIAALRRMNFVFGDLRNYGLALHQLGARLYENSTPFEQLGNACPPLMKDGCIHGYVMQYVYRNDILQGIILCESATDTRVRFGCMHALGHSYIETNTITINEAEQVFCKRWSNDDYRACVSGLFHEYTKGGTGTDHALYYHSHKKYVAPDCGTFSGEMVNFCYAAQGSFRQYYADSEPIEITYAFCDSAPTEIAQQLCRAQAHERIQIAKGYSSVVQ